MIDIKLEVKESVQKYLNTIIYTLTERREQLGMSDYDIARRVGISQPTVYRILSGQNPNASFKSIVAIAWSLGMSLEATTILDVGEMRQKRAHAKANKIAKATQASSALEGQGMDDEVFNQVYEKAKQKLLAGPAKDLWSE